jgi:hypothetical protein
MKREKYGRLYGRRGEDQNGEEGKIKREKRGR